jgi:hypothetical protein
MLPDFSRRHIPAAFVPRVNHGTPWVEANQPDLLVDANFSTIWSTYAGWSSYALKAVLNSSWSRLFMEAIGTPLGGGALKLEATHLRRILLPPLNKDQIGRLDRLGAELRSNIPSRIREIDGILFEAISDNRAPLSEKLYRRMQELASARRR